MKAVVILPTYNEKENIKTVVTKLFSVFKKIKKHDMSILVVDDSSPDGTAEEVKKLQKRYKKLHMITGQKKGLGVAYIRGFKHAISKLKADVLFEMDADMSHPPKLIPRFLREIDKGADFVVGSRYIKGGGAPDWGLKRRAISWGGNFFARIIAGLFKVKDCTSGFRAIKTSLIKKINLDKLHIAGYSFQMNLLYESISKGAKIVEIPLVFYDRKLGKSKISGTDIGEFFINAFRLRIMSMKKLIKFFIVGASGIVVNLGLFSIAKMIFYNTIGQSDGTLLGASLIGDEISILSNFLLNNIWTFKKTKNSDPVMGRIVKFHIVSLTSILINNSVLFFLHKGFGIPDVLAKFIGILVAFFWNYFFSIKWTWREK